MTYPSDEPDLEAVCEFLGLADDADSHATYATEAHRCYRMANPTRIASAHQENYCLGANHVSCPIFRGEGVAQTTRTATPPPLRDSSAREPGAVRTAGAPPAGRPRPAQRPRPPRESIGPRPRAGGVSMPAATVGLIILAIAIVGLAFLVQSLLGDGDDSPAAGDPVATRSAQTQTAQAGQGGQTPGVTQTAGGNQTPGSPTATSGTGTPGTTTRTPGPTTGAGETHIVKAGEFCGTIADLYNITVEDIIRANPSVGANCDILAGQELKIPN